MRKALNENRTVQIAVVGGLILIAAVVFLINSGGGDGDPGPATGTETTAPTGSVPDSSGAVAPATPDATAAPDAAAVDPSAMTDLPVGPELPDAVTEAYERGDTIALLVVREGGLEDASVRRALNAVRGEAGVTVFVTSTEGVARYARLTQGAGVTRVPALVVVRPKHLSGGTPVAQVHYGFRTPASVVQAVLDARYAGSSTTYGPDS